MLLHLACMERSSMNLCIHAQVYLHYYTHACIIYIYLLLMLIKRPYSTFRIFYGFHIVSGTEGIHISSCYYNCHESNKGR